MATQTKNDKRDIALTNLLREIMDVEGGQFIEADGTMSFHGFNQKTADGHFKQKGKPSKDVRELTFGDSKEIFNDQFLAPNGIKNVPDSVLPVVADFSFNSGPAQAATSVQRAIGMTGSDIDGLIGPNTSNKIKEFIRDKGSDSFVNAVSDERLRFLDKVSQDSQDIRNVLGGLNDRVDRLRQFNIQQIGGNR